MCNSCFYLCGTLMNAEKRRLFSLNQRNQRLSASKRPIPGIESPIGYIRICRKESGMQKIIGVTELQRKFRSFLESVVRKRIPSILTRGSRLEAVLIPYEDYL